MTDNELFQLIIPIISNGLIEDGTTGIPIIQAFQPTQQGVDLSPGVYIAKMGDKRYGWVTRDEKWDSINSVKVLTETQRMETTFRIEALVIQNPLDTSLPTASDLVNQVAMILAATKTIEILSAVSVGILRIMEVTNDYSKDDRDQFEASPSFNFILTHARLRTTEIPVVESVESVFARV